MWNVIIGLILVLSIVAAPALAGPVEDALAAYNLGDYAQALALYQLLAAQGNTTAQYNLGIMYENGQGVPQDYGQAVQWYRQVAEQGDAPAQGRLGAMGYPLKAGQFDVGHVR